MNYGKEDYAVRVTNASPLQLVLINFEIILARCGEVKSASGTGDITGFENCLASAKEFLNLLMTSLDMTYDISKELMKLYIFINSLLVKAEMSKSSAPIDTATDMLEKLYLSFEKISKTDAGRETDAVMQNAEQIFAGLTYKNGKLSEYIDEDTERGFKV